MAGTDVSRVSRATSLSDVRRLREQLRKAIDLTKKVFFFEEIPNPKGSYDARLDGPNSADTYRLVTLDVTELQAMAVQSTLEQLIRLAESSKAVKTGLIAGWNHTDGRRYVALSGVSLHDEAADLADELSEATRQAFSGLRSQVLSTDPEHYVPCPHTDDE
jgi:hypothetical protein